MKKKSFLKTKKLQLINFSILEDKCIAYLNVLSKIYYSIKKYIRFLRNK